MGKGRKATLDSVKIMKGTDQKCRMSGKGTSLAVISKVPPSPSWFTPLARKIYKDATRELMSKHLLHVVSLTSLVSFCNMMAKHLELEQEMSEEGRFVTIESKTGSYETISPKHKASKDALELALKIAVEFGFTPVSSQRIINQVTKKDDNDKFFD